MQNAWRFVDNEVLRDRLKEAKGIGTPATRAEIIGGLKKQGFLIAQRKNIVPTKTRCSLKVIGGPSLDMQNNGGLWRMTGTEPHAWRTGLMDDITYVGLDVHKATVCVAVAEGGRGGEVRQLGVFDNRVPSFEEAGGSG